ncbi:transglycosylase SLT domain-containing protein [Microvirga aerilata]|uniref:transglycosylase SLT domain-containing protein n=1 Tax=Microvirga aerilata TaxID=670292 RepID=UPI003640B0F1
MRYASENDLPYELADAVVRLESRYNAGARNGPNMGLTQINFRTAQSLGYQGRQPGFSMRRPISVTGSNIWPRPTSSPAATPAAPSCAISSATAPRL